VKFTADNPAPDFVIAVQSLSVPVAKAATLAIKNAGALLKQTARSHIASAGFSRKWQNAYRVTVYPQKGYSVDAAAFGLFKGIKYSDIFGLGGRISAHKGELWLPFPTTPLADRRHSQASPKDYKNKGIKLVSFKSKAGVPLLAAPVAMSRSQASRKIVKLSFGELAAGAKKQRKGAKNVSFVNRNVPLFHGVKSVAIKKRFNWDQVQEAVQNQVPGLYYSAIQSLGDA
jgi:hypothetical protein